MLKIRDEKGELVAVLKDDDASPELTEAGKKKNKKTKDPEIQEDLQEDTERPQ